MNQFVEKCSPYLRKPYVDIPWLHSHPYYWAVDGPVRNTNFRVGVHWRLNIFIAMAYSCFVVFRAGQVYWDPSKPVNGKFYMAVAIMLCSLPLVYNVTVATTTAEFAPFLRGYLKFLREGTVRKLQRKWACDRRSPFEHLQKMCMVVLATSNLLIWITPVALTVLNVIRPNSPEFLSSVFIANNRGIIRFTGILGSCIFEAYYATCLVQLALFCFTAIFFVTFSMPAFV